MQHYLHGLACQENCGNIYPMNCRRITCECGGQLMEEVILFSRTTPAPRNWQKATINNAAPVQSDHCLDTRIRFELEQKPIQAENPKEVVNPAPILNTVPA
ncbi:MAG: hypothetical protein ABIG29_01015 [Candidatus Nealsonbacteria bacterium]